VTNPRLFACRSRYGNTLRNSSDPVKRVKIQMPVEQIKNKGEKSKDFPGKEQKQGIQTP
jgi:hypothetical protein